MNPSPQVESRPLSAPVISSLVVLNIIWWMVMIAAVGFGATHLSRCPVQPYIPIYLIVLGALSILSLSVTYTKTTWGDGVSFITGSVCTVFLHLFSFAWLIAGTVWVYRVYPPDYTQGPRYCHKTTYLFAFAITTMVWVIPSLMFICGCCLGLLGCCTTVSIGHRFIPNTISSYGATGGSQDPTVGDV